ncbi:MAG: glutamate 5-kinase [Atribacterota bacterium]|nr:glutamate 5-kinase [Atribacterota bacterium]
MIDFKDCKRLVLKIGTSTIMKSNKKINISILEKISEVIAALHKDGKEIVVVSSGAIGVGSSRMSFTEKPKKLEEKQATAAIGQGVLMNIYENLFGKHNITVAQILLTRQACEDSIQRLNTTNTFNALFRFKAVPIVNENDTIAVEEIVYGDNDTLSAVVAVLIKADLLIMLSDTDGLYSGDPRQDKDAQKIPLIECVDERISSFAYGAGSAFGTGGMKTKISAAKLATNNGIHAAIIHGEKPHHIIELIHGQNNGTVFLKGNNEKENCKND